MKKYVIVGVQGCGKGTQASMLVEAYDLVHISIGDIFRWNIKAHTKLGAEVKRIVAQGKLVPDEVVNAIVRKRLEEHDWNYGFILDGYPRSRPQAEYLLERYDLDAVILIDVPDQLVMERILARRLCAVCGRDYNLISKKPPQPEACACGGKLTQRADDNEQAIRGRIQDYHDQTAPVLELFRRKNERVVTAAGVRGPQEIQADIRRQLNLPEPARK